MWFVHNDVIGSLEGVCQLMQKNVVDGLFIFLFWSSSDHDLLISISQQYLARTDVKPKPTRA